MGDIKNGDQLFNKRYIENKHLYWKITGLTAAATIDSTNGVQGGVKFYSIGSQIEVEYDIRGLIPGEKYELCVHEYGDLTRGCDSAGKILNSIALTEKLGMGVHFTGISDVQNIIGKMLVIHHKTVPDNENGIENRIACGVIGHSE
jgi:Cu/Zn superoxide dismutase